MRVLRLLLASGLSGLLGAGLAATPARANAAVVDLTNSERASRNLGALEAAEDLTAFAQRKADDMAAKRELKHTDDLGAKVSGWNRLGENIGRGPRIEDVHREFMASPSHAHNILEPAYTQIGAGVARAGRVVYVAVIYRQPTQRRPLATPPVAQPQAPPRSRKASAPRNVAPRPKPTPTPAPVPEPAPQPPPEPPFPQIVGPFIDEPQLLPSEARAPDQEDLVTAVLAAQQAQSMDRSTADSLGLARASLAGSSTPKVLVHPSARTGLVQLAASLLALVTTGQVVVLRQRSPLRKGRLLR
ncbi:MAG: CAP domain-containing protein [Acidimicrobiia bacterium]